MQDYSEIVEICGIGTWWNRSKPLFFSKMCVWFYDGEFISNLYLILDIFYMFDFILTKSLIGFKILY